MTMRTFLLLLWPPALPPEIEQSRITLASSLERNERAMAHLREQARASPPRPAEVHAPPRLLRAVGGI